MPVYIYLEGSLSREGSVIYLDNLIPNDHMGREALSLVDLVPPPGLGSRFLSEGNIASSEDEESVSTHDVVNTCTAMGHRMFDANGTNASAVSKENQSKFTKANSIFDSFTKMVVASDVPFGKYAKSFTDRALKVRFGRCRDVLPLPPFEQGDLEWKTAFDETTSRIMTNVVRLCAAGLNYLAGGQISRFVPSRLNRLHKFTLNGILSKVVALFDNMEALDRTLDVNGAFEKLTKGGTSNVYPELIASSVDVSYKCANIDPTPFIDPTHQSVISDPDKMFPCGAKGLPRHVAYKGANRNEYLKLVARQLRSGKTRLMLRPSASGDIFVVPKKNDRQREVWHGGRISDLSVPPPMPPYLANPHALGNLECSDDSVLYASGRDGRSWFDQLHLHDALQPFTGRPYVSICELVDVCEEGLPFFSLEEIKRFIIDLNLDEAIEGHSIVVPVSTCWPMGYSWSSFVAQSVMIGSCLHAGFSTQQFLTDAGHLPDPQLPPISVATDDVVMFWRGSEYELEKLREPPFSPLDRAWENLGIEQQYEKAFDLKKSVDVLGVSLCNGHTLAPKSSTLWSLLEAAIDLEWKRICSPLDCSSFLGSLQWLDLLDRSLLSCLHVVYAFTRSEPAHKETQIWPCALSELLHNLCLCPLFMIDLRRPWANQVFATDASSSFGFGMCRAHLHPSIVREAAADAGNGAHHFVLRDSCTNHDKIRPGKQIELPLNCNDFRTVLSVQARRTGHSGYLEAEAVCLAIRRLGRSTKLHNHRLLFLIDASAVLGALQKGRSSAPTLRSTIRHACSLMLALGIRIRFGYITTEANPADPPSRGKRGLTANGYRTRRRHVKRALPPRLDAYCGRIVAAMRRHMNPEYTESMSARNSRSSCSTW